MTRPITLFTGQWADMPLETLAEKASQWGYSGLELACWGDHFEVDRALSEDNYCQSKIDLLEKHGLSCFAISNHLVGQAVSDPIDARHQSILPDRVWGDGDPLGVQNRAAKEMMNTAVAANELGVKVVNGFTGSPIWHKLYFFPPTSVEDIQDGYRLFASQWKPILDVFVQQDVRFALEVHPTEIAYDLITFEHALRALDEHPAFGINFDPSHLIWQGIDPVNLINRFPDRIFHVHMKDAARTLDGTNSILGGHLGFGDHRRGWDFRSLGRGEVDFEEIIRALNRVCYDGPLSVEWEDSAMDREHGACEAAEFVRQIDFPSSDQAFDAAFDSDENLESSS
ncbi:MAG: sugar phosphate isomerase/epimerase [Gammaproteobacteria bacterium]|nr:sugar phosphate isomerase/epimerase [Gammaproteobacteria bacterium]